MIWSYRDNSGCLINSLHYNLNIILKEFTNNFHETLNQSFYAERLEEEKNKNDGGKKP